MKALLILVLLSACSLKNFNRATLIASTASLACDFGQTHSAASQGWKTNHETNPVMGKDPSTKSVDTYFASSIVFNAALWYILPEKYKSIVPIGIMAIQTDAIYSNMSIVPKPECGL